jgi:hypothetical protein
MVWAVCGNIEVRTVRRRLIGGDVHGNPDAAGRSRRRSGSTSFAVSMSGPTIPASDYYREALPLLDQAAPCHRRDLPGVPHRMSPFLQGG